MDHKQIMHRTLIQVCSISRKGYKVLLMGWNPRLKFYIKHEIIPTEFRVNIIDSFLSEKHVFMFCETNIGADLVTDLKFSNFEWAPEPKYKTLEEYITKQ